ncbi:MAG TPA: hypothetical protein VGM47_05415 [Gammaproteobacteria bacterium]
MPSRPHSKVKSRLSHVPWPRVAGIAGLVVLILVSFVVGRHWLSIDSLRAHRDALQHFVAAHYWASLSVLA